MISNKNNAIFRGYVTGSIPITDDLLVFGGSKFEYENGSIDLTEDIKIGIHQRIITVIGESIIDDDTLAPQSRTHAPSQRSVKNYIDSGSFTANPVTVEYVDDNNVPIIEDIAGVVKVVKRPEDPDPPDWPPPPPDPDDPPDPPDINETLNFSLDSNGGDEGYFLTVPLDFITTQPYTLTGYFNAYGRPSGIWWDRLIVSSNRGVMWDTGCVTGEFTDTFSLPVGSYYVTVEVIPNCNIFRTGTAWRFTLNTV